MGREGASAPYWRYRSGREKLTMSTSRTAERPPSVVPAIAYRRTSIRSVGLAKPASGALALSIPPFPVAGSLDVTNSWRETDFLYPTPVWQMWTRAASPSRHEQSQRSCRSTDAPPCLLCCVRVILCDYATGSSEHSGPDTIPAGQDGHVDDDDHRERPEGAKGDQ